MVNTYGSSGKATHMWFADPLTYQPLTRPSNRFLPLANMPTSVGDLCSSPTTPPSAPSSHHRKKKNSSNNSMARRKRYSRGAKRFVDRESTDRHANSMTSYAYGGPHPVFDDETPESYVPQLDVMLNEVLTMDNLPRDSPPVTFRAKKRSGKRRGGRSGGGGEAEDELVDWDVVSICSEESFCMV